MARLIRLATIVGFFKLCSQILITRQWLAVKALEAATSRARFRAILETQYDMFELGARKHLGHPCQKQPSTNTATLLVGKTKSGRPGSWEFLRHPLNPYFRKTAISANSVERLPDDFTAAMTSDLTILETVSATSRCYLNRIRRAGSDSSVLTASL